MASRPHILQLLLISSQHSYHYVLYCIHTYLSFVPEPLQLHFILSVFVLTLPFPGLFFSQIFYTSSLHLGLKISEMPSLNTQYKVAPSLSTPAVLVSSFDPFPHWKFVWYFSHWSRSFVREGSLNSTCQCAVGALQMSRFDWKLHNKSVWVSVIFFFFFF